MWKRGSILLQSARQRSCTYVYLVTETFCSMRSRFLSEHFRDLEVCMVWCTHSVPVCQCAMPYSIAYYGNTIYLRLDPSCTFFRLWYFIAWHTSPKMNERETEMENDKTNFIRWIHSKLIQLIKTIFFVSLHYAIKIAASEYVGSYFVYSIKCFALESRTYILLHLYIHVHVPRLVRLHVYIEFKLCMNFIRCAHFETIVLLCTEITRFQMWTFLTMYKRIFSISFLGKAINKVFWV